MVNGAAMSVPGATHVPLPKWLAGQEDEEQSAEGGQLLLMMVGDQHLANLRRAMDQQVGSRLLEGAAEISIHVHMHRMQYAAGALLEPTRCVPKELLAFVVVCMTCCSDLTNSGSALPVKRAACCRAAARSCAATVRRLW
jgi:hypothetical protein